MEHLSPDGKLAFITPTSWVGKKSNTKKADWTPFTDNHVELYKILSPDEKKLHFSGVGSGFGYFILSSGKGKTKIILEDGSEVEYTLVEGEPLPNRLTPVSFAIHNKLSKTEKIIFNANLTFHSQTLKRKQIVSDTPNSIYQYKTYYSHNLIRYTSKKQDIYSLTKVMIPNVGSIKNAWVSNDCNITEDVAYIPVSCEEEGKNAIKVLNSKLFKYIGALYRTGRNLGLAIKFLPKLDFSKVWTDQEIYDHFSLTQEEIDYIESNVK
jgi:hypothetical protein